MDNPIILYGAVVLYLLAGLVMDTWIRREEDEAYSVIKHIALIVGWPITILFFFKI